MKKKIIGGVKMLNPDLVFGPHFIHTRIFYKFSIFIKFCILADPPPLPSWYIWCIRISLFS